MKKLIASLCTTAVMLSSMALKAQLRIGSEGITVLDGTVLSTEGLTMVPSSEWSINNVNILKQTAVVIWPKFNSISRRYSFSRPVTLQGELALTYTDVDLNGNDAKNLVLAYSKVTSNAYTDYNFVKESVVNTKERSVGQLFANPFNLADLTAVTMETALATPYIDVVANNMITPNGDGVNDTWVVANIEQYKNNELKIFDREGRIVFTMIGYDNSWKGDFNGNPLQEDTYYYILIFDSGKGKKSGFISIVREQK